MRLYAGLEHTSGGKVSKMAELQLMMILVQANCQYPKLMKLVQKLGKSFILTGV
jgi:hypothetical protein